ncbi:hypothetical protein F2Q69_00047174 [Brassica cretica]|uniref:Uncharacterized protein n=1 Tax=Brassica cretica TaxID=69181 RepID=A0A8S9PUW8_BRACR|nr:hypothetical protein F2Q69_00047174 [Brassica cretica]
MGRRQCSVQLANLASWTIPTRQMGESDGLFGPTRQMGKLDGFGRSNPPIWRIGRLRSVELAHLASWTACSIQLAHLGLEQPSLKAYLVNPFRTCYET